MALYGVLGDIHGNREALEAVARARSTRAACEQLLCVGDIVGYNADPDECVAMVRSAARPAIAGNHDLIGIGRLGFSRCSNKASTRSSARGARSRTEAAAYLAALPPTASSRTACVLVHGGVRDVQQYMVTPAHIRENAQYLREDFPGARVCFFGHSHEQKVYAVRRRRACSEVPPMRRASSAEGERVYFINPGSVDASRKRRHKLAECAIFDSALGTVEFLRVRLRRRRHRGQGGGVRLPHRSADRPALYA